MLCLNDNGTVTKLGDTVFDGGVLSPTGNFTMPYDLVRDSANDTLTMTFAGAYASEVLEVPYLSSYGYNEDDDEYDIPVYGNFFLYPHLSRDGDTFAGTLTLNSQAISNSGGWVRTNGFGRRMMLFPDSAFSTPGLRWWPILVGLRCSLIPFSTPITDMRVRPWTRLSPVRLPPAI